MVMMACAFKIFLIILLSKPLSHASTCDTKNQLTLDEQCKVIREISERILNSRYDLPLEQFCIIKTKLRIENDITLVFPCIANLISSDCSTNSKHSEYFLTSAHCVDVNVIKDELKRDKQFKIPKSIETEIECRIAGKKTILKVEKLSPHPKYGEELKYLIEKLSAKEFNLPFNKSYPGLNDIAVGKINCQLEIKPLCLDSDDPKTILERNNNCFIIKQGKKPDLHVYKSLLVNPMIQPHDVLYSDDLIKIIDGDSGGALVCQKNGGYVVSGINSAEFFSKTKIQLVSPVINWIQDQIRNLKDD